jgi:hypothetical protein
MDELSAGCRLEWTGSVLTRVPTTVVSSPLLSTGVRQWATVTGQAKTPLVAVGSANRNGEASQPAVPRLR